MSRLWTYEELEALEEGIKKFGNRWTEMVESDSRFRQRSAEHLKQKVARTPRLKNLLKNVMAERSGEDDTKKISNSQKSSSTTEEKASEENTTETAKELPDTYESNANISSEVFVESVKNTTDKVQSYALPGIIRGRARGRAEPLNLRQFIEDSGIKGDVSKVSSPSRAAGSAALKPNDILQLMDMASEFIDGEANTSTGEGITEGGVKGDGSEVASPSRAAISATLDESPKLVEDDEVDATNGGEAKDDVSKSEEGASPSRAAISAMLDESPKLIEDDEVDATNGGEVKDDVSKSVEGASLSRAAISAMLDESHKLVEDDEVDATNGGEGTDDVSKRDDSFKSKEGLIHGASKVITEKQQEDFGIASGLLVDIASNIIKDGGDGGCKNDDKAAAQHDREDVMSQREPSRLAYKNGNQFTPTAHPESFEVREAVIHASIGRHATFKKKMEHKLKDYQAKMLKQTEDHQAKMLKQTEDHQAKMLKQTEDFGLDMLEDFRAFQEQEEAKLREDLEGSSTGTQ